MGITCQELRPTLYPPLCDCAAVHTLNIALHSLNPDPEHNPAKDYICQYNTAEKAVLYHVYKVVMMFFVGVFLLCFVFWGVFQNLQA